MKTVIIFLLVIAVIAAVVIAAKMPKTGKTNRGRIGPKPIATANEQGMFWRLIEAFPAPEYVVLTQVSFGAMLTTKDRATRNSFDRKIADFVVTNKGFKVLAIIELDDKSHNGREQQDASRDAILREAGYNVLRYKRTPEAKQLLADVLENPSAESNKLPPAKNTVPMPLHIKT